jgi:hypothetical protein
MRGGNEEGRDIGIMFGVGLWHRPGHDPHHHLQPECVLHDVDNKIYNVNCGAGVLVGSAGNQGGIDRVELQANLEWRPMMALPLAFGSQAQQQKDKEGAMRSVESATEYAVRGQSEEGHETGIILARSLAPACA